MTYRDKAEKLLTDYLGVNEYNAKDIVRVISEECEYKPCVFRRLNAPEELEDWDLDASKDSIGFKISFYNDGKHGKEILNLPITMNGKVVGVITEVNNNEIVGCVWHKRATLEIEQAGNNIVGFELTTQ